MNHLKGNCLVSQSGGPSSVINSSAYGVIKEFLSLDSGYKVFAGLYGIRGIIDEKIIDIGKVNRKSLESMRYSPSSALGSCRYKLLNYEDNEEDYVKLMWIFRKYNIKYFLYIGGNDSMDAAYKINKFCKISGYDMQIIGVPKTIDNDLVETDHCPGFGSAAKYLINAGLEMWFDINTYNKDSIMLMEVMGRDSGWLAASTGILNGYVPNINQLIYMPEVYFDKTKFLEDVEKSLKANNKLLIVVSEGLKGKDGQYINVADNSYKTDSFGHKQLGGVGNYLQMLIKNRITTSIKLTEVGVMQRCAMHCVSKTDVEEAEKVGRVSVRYALSGFSGYMTALERLNSKEYRCDTRLVRLGDVCNKVKHVPLDWISEQGNQVKNELINYVKPLILGEEKVYGNDGILKCRNASIFKDLSA